MTNTELQVKHTPAPWLVESTTVTAAERDKLKEINVELLEALKELMKPFNGEVQSCDAYKNAKAVIAKAEGKA